MRRKSTVDTFACLLCDWIGRPRPVLEPRGGGGGIEFLHLTRCGLKPLMYALEVVMDGTALVRLCNFETRDAAGGWAIWFHIKENCHCRVRPVRDYFAADEVDPNLCSGSSDYCVLAR